MVTLPHDPQVIYHPLAEGCPPEWAAAWGQDRYGPWVELHVGAGRQRLRWLPPGRFHMGSPAEEEGRDTEEGPRHLVTLSRGFWLFDTPCTQALWEAVMSENPSRFRSPERPVEQVDWDDCQTFITQLNEQLPGLHLSLATEAQWEYACRAGSETATYAGDLRIVGENNAPSLNNIAWYGGNSGVGYELEVGEDSSGWPRRQYKFARAGTRRVGGKEANPWGLYETCWATCGNGVRMDEEPTPRPRCMIPLVPRPRVTLASSVAVPGNPARGSCVRRPGTGAPGESLSRPRLSLRRVRR
jgi:hypothetical protein